MRLLVALLLSFAALVLVALGGSDRVPEFAAPADPTVRVGHERDERIAEGRARTRMLRAASAGARARTPVGGARIRIAAFDDLDDDAGGDDGAPSQPSSHGSDDDAGTECSARAVRAPSTDDDRAIVAAIEQSANLGPASGFARRQEHPPKA